MKKQAKWLSPKADEKSIPGFAKPSEETFTVGERKQPVYIPGASTLDGGQLDEILQDQTEKSDAESKATAAHTPSTREDRDKVEKPTKVIEKLTETQKVKQLIETAAPIKKTVEKAVVPAAEVAKRGTKRKYYGGFG